MHLATEADIPFINEVLNDPKVRPHVWDEPGVIDATDAIEIVISIRKGSIKIIKKKYFSARLYFTISL